MRVTCGRHLPVPGSQRQSEPAQAAAAITAAAKSSARSLRHVSRPPAGPTALPRAGRRPWERAAGRARVPVRAPRVPRARVQAGSRDCVRLAREPRVPGWLAGTMAARGKGEDPASLRPTPVTMAASLCGSTLDRVCKVALIWRTGKLRPGGGRGPRSRSRSSSVAGPKGDRASHRVAFPKRTGGRKDGQVDGRSPGRGVGGSRAWILISSCFSGLLPLPPPPLLPRLGRVGPLRPLQTSPVTGDCSRPRPRWMR